MSVYGFRFYFTPLNGVLFTFPSRYLCTIGRRSEYLALDRGRPGFQQGSSCPAVLRYRITESPSFRVRGFHALCQTFPNLSAIKQFYPNSAGHPHAALQPRFKRFRLLRFRSPLLTESLLISFPVLLRWFTSHSLSLPTYFIQPSQCVYLYTRVTPFGYPCISGYVLLHKAFRSLSRPSSSRVSITGIRHRPIFA